MPIKKHLTALAILVFFLWVAPSVQAEPYLAIQEGYKCSKCHVNMTGGGKRTDFANIYVQTRLANSFLNWRGLLPESDEDIDEETAAKVSLITPRGTRCSRR